MGIRVENVGFVAVFGEKPVIYRLTQTGGFPLASVRTVLPTIFRKCFHVDPPDLPSSRIRARRRTGGQGIITMKSVAEKTAWPMR